MIFDPVLRGKQAAVAHLLQNKGQAYFKKNRINGGYWKKWRFLQDT